MKARWLTLVLVFLFVGAHAAGDIKAGESKTSTCVACHGPDGNSLATIWPKIAGQHESYLIEQLKEFRKGEQGLRYEPQMYGMSVNLTDQDILDLAAYYASQPSTGSKTPSQYVDLGTQIYRGGLPDKGVPACTACHSPNGKGNELARYPRVWGQHADYSLSQLKAFREGKRKNDPNGIMQDIAMKMTDDEMKAVSEYMAGLH